MDAAAGGFPAAAGAEYPHMLLIMSFGMSAAVVAGKALRNALSSWYTSSHKNKPVTRSRHRIHVSATGNARGCPVAPPAAVRGWWHGQLREMDARHGRQDIEVGESEVSLVGMESCMVQSLVEHADKAECLDEGAASMKRMWSSSIGSIA